VAIGFSTPSRSAWRVIVFEVKTGNARGVLENTNAILRSLALPAAPYYPHIAYFDETAIHFQLSVSNPIPLGEALTIAWSPSEAQIETSPYIQAGINVLPSTRQGVFVQSDPASTVPFSALATTDGTNTTVIMPPGESTYSSPQWVNAGQLIFFRTAQALDASWYLYDPTTEQRQSIGTDLVAAQPTLGGVIGVTGAGDVSYYTFAAPSGGKLIYRQPDAMLIWAQPEDSQFLLTELGVEPDATVNTNRLNLRENPGEGAPILDALNRDTEVTITGRLANNTWVQITTLDGKTGWVFAQFLIINADLNTIPVINTLVIPAGTSVPTTPGGTPPTPGGTTPEPGS